MSTRIKREWTVIFCKPAHWRMVPKMALQKDAWPRTFQFHWLFFYCHCISEPI